MRYLGLDLGTKTLGVSITDSAHILVSPLEVIHFEFEDYKMALKKVEDLLKKYEISLIVLGLPKNMDGSIGFAGERSLNFKNMLDSLGVPVELVDERLTTKSALDIVHLNKGTVKSSKKKIDSIAACIILESYLKKVK